MELTLDCCFQTAGPGAQQTLTSWWCSDGPSVSTAGTQEHREGSAGPAQLLLQKVSSGENQLRSIL